MLLNIEKSEMFERMVGENGPWSLQSKVYNGAQQMKMSTKFYSQPEGRWFDPQLGQYSFRGLMIAIATGFIPLSPLSVVLTMVMWESSQWLGKNILWSIG